jgi:hypothetical protein
MNNNKIKILSVIVLLLFVGLFAMPFFTHISCDVAGCGESSNTCDMDMAGADCCESMTECTVIPFQPITSAPINKVTLQKDLTIDYNISFSENFNISEEYTLLEVVDKICFSEVHPGFQTPLLV